MDAGRKGSARRHCFCIEPHPVPPRHRGGSDSSGLGALIGVRVAGVCSQSGESDVYDLEVEGAHSFITETCVVRDWSKGTTTLSAQQS